MTHSEAPIGIFDSGVGGLTVVRAIRALLPAENVVYLGDTARVPYGSKSPTTVRRYAHACARFLLDQDIKILLIACNTATAHALGALVEALPVPVIGAIEPGARTARSASKSGHIGVIGTLGTIRSGAYEAALKSLGPGVEVTGHPCALFVPLAEEGWTDDEVAARVADRYLRELAARDPRIDTLVLGCTHYPLLQPLLARIAEAVFTHRVTLVDSASAMARVTRDTLAARVALRAPVAAGPTAPGAGGWLRCFVTDASRLEELAPRFLGESLGGYETVDL